MNTNEIAVRHARDYIDSVGTHQEIGITETIKNAITEATQGMWNDEDLRISWLAALTAIDKFGSPRNLQMFNEWFYQWLTEYKQREKK